MNSIPEHLMKSMLQMATVALNQRDLKDISKSSLQMLPNGLDRYSLFQLPKGISLEQKHDWINNLWSTIVEQLKQGLKGIPVQIDCNEVITTFMQTKVEYKMQQMPHMDYSKEVH